MKLLSPPRYNHKMRKSESHGWYTPILHLAPHTISGYQTCPMARGCEKTCLFFSGQGRFSNAQNARIRKTRLFFEDRDLFMALLVSDIWESVKTADRLGLRVAIRPNGTSDLAWEKFRAAGRRNLMELFPDVQFYDYTKIWGRQVPSNYHLTFSQDVVNEETCRKALAGGMNVASIFTGEPPVTWLDHPVIDGDRHDLRFLDPQGVVVGLKEKKTVILKEAA